MTGEMFMTTTATAETTKGNPRFVRRTSLREDEYRTNFRQMDCDIMTAVTSKEACRVSAATSKIYMRLVNADTSFWERTGVLRFGGVEKDGKWLTAWEQLLNFLEVASATAHKVLNWMHDQGIIGYFAGKNGVGIRIFINRAQSSIATRKPQKFLPAERASIRDARTSPNEVPFKDSFAVLEVLENNCIPHAPKSGANKISVQSNIEKTSVPRAAQTAPPACAPPKQLPITAYDVAREMAREVTPEVMRQIQVALQASMQSSIAQWTRQAAQQEHARTREWLDKYGLPKAARVAQREAYNVFKHLQTNEAKPPPHACMSVAPESNIVSHAAATCEPKAFTEREITEVIELCKAMFEVQGKPFETTLAEISTAQGGWVPAEFLEQIRQALNPTSSLCESQTIHAPELTIGVISGNPSDNKKNTGTEKFARDEITGYNLPEILQIE